MLISSDVLIFKAILTIISWSLFKKQKNIVQKGKFEVDLTKGVLEFMFLTEANLLFSGSNPLEAFVPYYSLGSQFILMSSWIFDRVLL